MNTVISNKADLKAHIAAKKLSERAIELAKTLVDQSNSVDSRLMTHQIAKAIGDKETFGNIILGAAKLYTDAKPSVDMRMCAGKTMLEAISLLETVKPDTNYTLDLPELPTYIDTKDGDKAFEVCSELLVQAEESHEMLTLVQNAVFEAILKSHPTIAQQFLASSHGAMISIKGSQFYSELGNAYVGGFPYI